MATYRRLFVSSGCEIWQYQRQNEVIGGLRGVLDMVLIFSGSSYIICANGSLSACLFLSAVLPSPQLVQTILRSLLPCLTSASRVVKLEFPFAVVIQQWKKAEQWDLCQKPSDTNTLQGIKAPTKFMLSGNIKLIMVYLNVCSQDNHWLTVRGC